MKSFKKLTIIFLTFSMVLLSVYVYDLYFKYMPPPILKNTTWWGYGRPRFVDKTITKFELLVQEEVLEDLKDRIDKYRAFETCSILENSYGLNASNLKELVTFWKQDYDWSKRQNYINKYPQYRVNIQGVYVHFVHVKPITDNGRNRKVVPLLLIHGWPGSFLDFYEIVPFLTNRDERFVFEIVIPSIPGHGFSQITSRRGFGSPQCAVMLNNLMAILGFDKYYVQGNSFMGSFIATDLAVLFPENVKGLYSNFCFSNSPLTLMKYILKTFVPSFLLEKGEKGEKGEENLKEQLADFHLEITKPDTIGFSLRQSPVGLAAFLMEKFKNLDEKITRTNYTQILDNVMISWITGSVTSSMRFQADTFSIDYFNNLHLHRVPVKVPTVCLKSNGNFINQPDFFLKDKYIDLIPNTTNYKNIYEIVEIIEKDYF